MPLGMWASHPMLRDVVLDLLVHAVCTRVALRGQPSRASALSTLREACGSDSRASLCVHLFRGLLWLQMCTTSSGFCMWVLGVRTQVLTFEWQALHPLSHLSSLTGCLVLLLEEGEQREKRSTVGRIPGLPRHPSWNPLFGQVSFIGLIGSLTA